MAERLETDSSDCFQDAATGKQVSAAKLGDAWDAIVEKGATVCMRRGEAAIAMMRKMGYTGGGLNERGRDRRADHPIRAGDKSRTRGEAQGEKSGTQTEAHSHNG